VDDALFSLGFRNGPAHASGRVADLMTRIAMVSFGVSQKSLMAFQAMEVQLPGFAGRQAKRLH
jgi:hypothetical protein